MVPGRIAWRLAALLALAFPAAAQETTDTEPLGRAVYADPSNIALGYEYARALVNEGRYQDAAAELERLLIVEPDQPRLVLELGVLRFRLGHYTLARSYLARALDAPGITDPVRERVRYYLEEAERRTDRSRIAGGVSFGLRFQTNANGGTNQDVVSGVVGPVRLPSDFRQRSDVNAYLGADITHSYDLELQRDAAVISSLGFFATRQTSPDFYNFAGLSLRSGVRFAPAPDAVPTLRLYPYIRGDAVLLNDNFYNAAVGPGLEISLSPTGRLVAALVLEQRFATYDAVPRVRNAKLLSGDERLALLRVGYRVATPVTLFAQGGVRDVETKRTQFDFLEYQLTVGVSALYPAPVVTKASTNWNLVASVGHYWRRYGGPDPVVDPGRTRSEKEWRFRLLNEIPILRTWSAIQQVEYWRNNANLPNYDRDNFIVSVGVTSRF